MSFLDELKQRFPHIGGGLERGQLNTIVAGGQYGLHSFQETFLRNLRLENIGYSISDDPNIHKRIREDGIKMNARHYEFLIGTPELYPYYVHNIFRDIVGIDKLYDYEEPPITKINVPDLRIASVYIENFKFVMASQSCKVPYKFDKKVILSNGKTRVVIELHVLE